LDESKSPEWMKVEINFKEVDISNDERPKMAWIGNYGMEK
jgi:hypothetical protein